jgi:hypothetical protein
VTVRLVTLSSPATGQPIVFAPPACFDGQPNSSTASFAVRVQLDRPLSEPLDVEIVGEGLAPDLPTGPFASIEPGSLEGSVRLACIEEPITSVALGTLVPGLVAGVPGAARVVPCEVLVGGVRVPCEEPCAARALYAVFCAAGYSEFGTGPSIPSGRPHGRTSKASGTGDDPLEALTALRDGPMSGSDAGRYYRDLYAAFSPELRSILLDDLRIPVDLVTVAPRWVEALAALESGGGDESEITPEMIAGMLRVFDHFETSASAPLRAVLERERQRLGFEDLAGQPIEALVERVEERGGAPPCAGSEETLCLQGGRFLVEVQWTDFEGSSGSGRVVPLSGDTGAFWFFDPDNVELVVKVLDARGVDGDFWVFYGALSNVEYTLLVTDTKTGAVRAYPTPAASSPASATPTPSTPTARRAAETGRAPTGATPRSWGESPRRLRKRCGEPGAGCGGASAVRRRRAAADLPARSLWRREPGSAARSGPPPARAPVSRAPTRSACRAAVSGSRSSGATSPERAARAGPSRSPATRAPSGSSTPRTPS